MIKKKSFIIKKKEKTKNYKKRILKKEKTKKLKKYLIV